MNILIFVASGATGHELVKQALTMGHQVTAFVRNPAKLRVRHDRLNVFQGDITDNASVEQSLEGQEAILCALGASTPFKRNPALVEGISNIVQAMETKNVPRFIYLSFIGLDEKRKDLGFVANHIAIPFLHNVVLDHQEKESIIKQSRLEWTIVRPPRLTNGRKTGKYRSGLEIMPTSPILTISRADLADFMLKQLSNTGFIRQAPRVMY